MGGRGSSYYEKKNASLEELMRSLENLFKLKQPIGKRILRKIEPDPESERNEYELFKQLKRFGISTRQSTDGCLLENLEPHQTQFVNLSKKYRKILKTLTADNEIEFSLDKDDSAFGFFASYEQPDGKIFSRLTLSNLVVNKTNEFVLAKKQAIKTGWAVDVDEANISIYTTTHEFGHLVEENIFRKKFSQLENKNIDYSIFSNKLATEIKNEVIKIYKKNYAKGEETDRINISDYSIKGGDFEWFAETFTNLELSSSPKPIALTKEAIQAYFREKADFKQDFELVRNPDKLSEFMIEEFKKTDCYNSKSEEERQEIIKFLQDNPAAYSDDHNILY